MRPCHPDACPSALAADDFGPAREVGAPRLRFLHRVRATGADPPVVQTCPTGISPFANRAPRTEKDPPGALARIIHG